MSNPSVLKSSTPEPMEVDYSSASTDQPPLPTVGQLHRLAAVGLDGLESFVCKLCGVRTSYTCGHCKNCPRPPTCSGFHYS